MFRCRGRVGVACSQEKKQKAKNKTKAHLAADMMGRESPDTAAVQRQCLDVQRQPLSTICCSVSQLAFAFRNTFSPTNCLPIILNHLNHLTHSPDLICFSTFNYSAQALKSRQFIKSYFTPSLVLLRERKRHFKHIYTLL